MTTEPPVVSVIVPVYNDAARLAACLDALAGQEGGAGCPFEVIVADNGSTDDVAGVVRRYPFAHVVREPRPGSYAARNAAARVAKGAVLAFTDADCVPAPTWTSAAAAATADGTLDGLVAGEIEVMDLSGDVDVDPAVVAYEAATAFRQDYYARVHSFGATANLIVPAHVFRAVGGFRDELKSGGDKDFGKRAAAKGYPVRYDPSVRVAHPPRRTAQELEGKVRRVVGGDFVASRGRPAKRIYDVLRYAFLRPAKSVWQVLRSPRLDAAQKALAVAVVGKVAAWQLHESWRLRRGAAPAR
jgi:glycosyltransferase involved in cell wall biosynthesis